MKNNKVKKVKIIKEQHTFVSNKDSVHMQSLKIEYEEKDVDLSEIKKMAQDSSRRIQNERENRLNKAIEDHDRYYISRELENVSTCELIKMIFNKL